MNNRYAWIRKLVIVALLGGLAAAGGTWYFQQNTTRKTEDRYRTQNIEKGTVTQTVAANGTLNPVVLVNVGTQVSGTAKKLYADFNDKVEAGQVLVQLDDSLFRAQLGQSEANVANALASIELAKANEARMQDLFKQEYVSRQELDQAVQALKAARAQLALAQAQREKDATNVAYTTIRSPVSGVVVAREVDVGQTVAASFQTPTLFKIAQDLRQMQIDSNFAEADIGNIKVGQLARFTVDAFPDRAFAGKVKQLRLNPTTQQNVVTYNVVVSVDNPEQLLLPGMTAYVNIVIAQHEGVLLVPNAALRFRPQDGERKARGPKGKDDKREAGSATVYIQEAGLAKPVRIKTGITDNRVTEVLSGELHEGDALIVEERGAADSGAPSSSSFRVRMF